MAANPVKRFRAVLEKGSNNLGWVIARLPFDIETAWKTKIRLRVQVEVGGELFRTSLFPDAVHGGHFLLVNKKMQQAADAKLGALVDFAVTADLEQREAVIPAEFAKLLKCERALRGWFEEQSESMKREVGKWLDAPKTPAARQRRAEQMAERMLLTMEGEKVLPPILEAAFRANPAARKGWDAMTLTQRRNNLLAIFYYQSPETRQKRVTKVVQDALRLAKS